MTLTSVIVNDIDHFHVGETSTPQVVVCIPAFNEQTRIGRVVKELSKLGYPVLVCDDGSSDHTALEAEINGAHVIKHDKNLGKGAALRSLFLEAQKVSPDIIVTIDGDGQHSPDDIPILLGPIIDESAEVVVGCRFGNGNSVPSYRKFGNSLLTALTNLSVETGVRDTQSGFRAYSSKVLPRLVISRNGMGVDSEILMRIAKDGFRIVERNVSINYDGETSTFNPVSHVFRVVWGLFLTITRERFRAFNPKGKERPKQIRN